ncbi:N-acetylmuramic acid 6-phosphate etherase [Paenibacillus polymyxa]|uniref:N-acetylmuramic acid 6-phosphate etherase n=1 Tax=Paenibacillus polymyxa TaxID=1406 RepID=UPI002AB381A2|nr:N-acetylmuramic acid 6-phosphate etherase [Paenibacillus polymyxa]MDY7991039.1 N-acetylmuramic acid 6-phosphate etherase [Paenibacillus polymyxa]MDY8119828.1 N-acetylmuramic acid 6-phosphate etherase [Paenibacillus polymyxa]
MQHDTSSFLTEQSNRKSAKLDQLSTQEILRLMNEEDRTIAVQVQTVLPDIEKAVQAIVAKLENGGKMYYIGAGSSGRIGMLDAAECPPTFGVDPSMVSAIIAGGEQAMFQAVEDAEDQEHAGDADVRARLTSRDVLIGLSASGRTPYVLGGLHEASLLNALTVSISCNIGTSLSLLADIPIEIPVGPEVITGSTRLKATTAQKMVLNMISSTVMIHLGKVYGNLMVNVQASNEKLRLRVVNIVMQATGVNEEKAQMYCQQAEGDARIAILMIKFGLQPDELALRLQQNQDHFGKTVEQLDIWKRQSEAGLHAPNEQSS